MPLSFGLYGFSWKIHLKSYFPLQVNYYVSQDFSLSLVYKTSVLIDYFSLFYPVWISLTSYICRFETEAEFGRFLAMISLSTFSAPSPFSSFSGSLMTKIIDILLQFSGFLKPSLIFLVLFFFFSCCSYWVISIGYLLLHWFFPLPMALGYLCEMPIC